MYARDVGLDDVAVWELSLAGSEVEAWERRNPGYW